MKTLQLLFLLVLFTLISCRSDRANSTNESKKAYTWDNGLEVGTANGTYVVEVTDENGNSIKNDWTPEKPSGDKYGELVENQFLSTKESPVSTFSIDADGASYSNIRRFLMEDKRLPPKDAIRTEELINYFDLDYPFYSKDDPISLNGEVSECPWNKKNKLVRIGIKGKPLAKKKRAISNFVFLIDVSGSMEGADRLGLLKRGFIQYVRAMKEEDRVAIVTYSGAAGLALPSTSGLKKTKIISAIHTLGSGGGTAGADGILTAYEIAQKHFIKGGNNRIILGSDGDFNVGVSDHGELVKLIEAKRDLGIYLTVLGVGRGNLNDQTMEQLANKGNGTYEYIDNTDQLSKIFVYNSSKFYTVAKDVKVQVKFNPENVKAYRLIGYENRLLNKEDFEDDTKDAGEIGANQNITALYEVVPKKNGRYKDVPTFTIDFRYKKPDMDVSTPMKLEIFDNGSPFSLASDYMKFTSGVASFAMLLQDSKYKGTSSYKKILTMMDHLKLEDKHGFKKEFIELVKSAELI